MIDRVAVLGLPLVHHLVQQRVQRLGPAVSPDVRARDRDLRRLAVRGRGRILAEPRPHAPRNAERDGRQRAAEVLIVVLPMPALELAHERRVLGTRPLDAARRRTHADVHRVPEDHLLRRATLGPRPTADESHDGLVHLARRIEVAAVHAKVAFREAHHHGAVVREPAGRDAVQAERAQPREQLLGVARRRVELERQLDRVVHDA